MCIDSGMIEGGMNMMHGNMMAGSNWFGTLYSVIFWLGLLSLIVLANYYLWNKIKKEFKK